MGELRTKYGVRSMPLRKDDEVQVVRGHYKGQQVGKIFSATEASSGSTSRGSRGRRPTGPPSTWASTPARSSSSSSRWTRIARTSLIAEPRDVLKLWARTRENTLKNLLLPWKLHK